MLIQIFILLFSTQILSTYSVEDLKKSNAGFFLTVPKALLSGKNATVCLSLHGASTPTKAIIDLKLKEKHFITTKHLDSDHACFELIAPLINSNEPKFVSVKVQAQLNGIVYSSHNQDPVVIYPNKNITFISTDRGSYKADDKVKFRILTLQEDLLPFRYHKVPDFENGGPKDIFEHQFEKSNIGVLYSEPRNYLRRRSLCL